MILYHYTCRDAAPLIVRDGYLKTNRQVQLANRELIWLTDLDSPDRDALGLTSLTLHCDRTEHRAVVDFDAVHWPRYARTLPVPLRRALEWEPGSLPMHWYVAAMRVPILSIAPTRAVVIVR